MAGRPITLLMFTFLFMNLWAGVLMQSGVASTIGIETNVGGDEKVNESLNRADDVATGSPTGSTLFGMYNVLATVLSTLNSITTAGPIMLERAGLLPGVLGTLLKNLFRVVIAVGIVSFLRGWGL